MQEPLGIEYLSAFCKSLGDASLVLDQTLEQASGEKIAKRTFFFQADIIGFSLTTAQELDALYEIYDFYKTFSHEKTICWVAGGNFISTEIEKAVKILPEDFTFVCFEGENALCELRQLWKQGGKTQGKIFRGKPVVDLNTLPFPERPFARAIQSQGGAFNIQASRGCFGSCSYCSSPGMGEGGNLWRGRTIKHIVDEMEYIFDTFHTSAFNFIDEDFLGPNKQSMKRAITFAEEIKKRHLKITFSIQVRPNSLDNAIIDMLADIGLTYVFMGIESDDKEDLKRWNRPWCEDPWSIVDYIQQKDIGINAGVLLFHSHSTIQKIRGFAKKLFQHGLLEFRSATNCLDAMPGSRIYKKALKQKVFKAEELGPQPLPFVDKKIELLYNDLLEAVAPLGPPSMHAVCAVPQVLAARPYEKKRYQKLQDIMHPLDKAVADTLFTLLNIYEKGKLTKDMLKQYQADNLIIAVKACENLSRNYFASSFEELREAIQKDTGL